MRRNTTAPTQAARDLTFRYYQEDSRQIGDVPANRWINEPGISTSSMIAFGDWKQRNDPQRFNRLLEEEAPPFQVPWSSADELFARVRELPEFNPRVKSITPDYPCPVSSLVASKGR